MYTHIYVCIPLWARSRSKRDRLQWRAESRAGPAPSRPVCRVLGFTTPESWKGLPIVNPPAKAVVFKREYRILIRY